MWLELRLSRSAAASITFQCAHKITANDQNMERNNLLLHRTRTNNYLFAGKNKNLTHVVPCVCSLAFAWTLLLTFVNSFTIKIPLRQRVFFLDVQSNLPSSLPLFQLFQCSGLATLLFMLITLSREHALHQSNNNNITLSRKHALHQSNNKFMSPLHWKS